MIEPRLFLCSGFQISEDDKIKDGKRIIELDSVGNDPNVNIRLEKLAKIFKQNFAPRLVDLLEIASYIYTADASTQRGTDWTDNNSTEAWERDFHFIIPVRDLTFWQTPEVIKLLLQIITFISNDKVKIDFVKLEKDRTVDEYLQFGELEDWEFYGIDRVTMFSGGLDSLAGITEQANQNHPLMLVSHSPVNTTYSRQKKLYEELTAKFDAPIQHIPVFINKDSKLGREFLQRTRSLLFSAIGTVIAESVKADGVRFYENGIVSLNLPVADEVLRARASRTTHPFTLKLFSDFYSLVTERNFIVDNPYILKTKKDIIEIIKLNNSADLIEHSCSCAHTGYFQSASQWHCGTCSQCIDRRVAIFAANAQELDPETDYVVDVFTGKRKDGYEKNIAVNFARHATELNRMSEAEIATKFSRDISRAIRNFSDQSDATQKLIQIHKEHGKSVCKVLAQKISENSEKLIVGEVDKSSMLFAVASNEHRESSWVAFAEKIIHLLNNGIPKSCQTHKPQNEPHLQEICDGILLANDNILVREFPFMRWSSGATKPDWSAEDLSFWVEAKYVRKKEDLGAIREALSSDITKYGDNGRRVLFFIYDPLHIITNESEFSNPINNRETMMMHFLR